MAELTKLLGFMSSWDRKAAIRKYERMFDAAADPEALAEELGTPTKVAVELARDYVSSPPPEEPEGPEATDPAQDSADGLPDISPAEADPVFTPAAATPPAAPKRSVRAGGVLLSLLFTVVIGIPVAALTICVGIPFLTAGVGLICSVIQAAPGALAAFNLLSDILLVLGAGLGLLAAGLLLAWLGLWISIALCRLWIGRVILPLDSRLSRGKEA